MGDEYEETEKAVDQRDASTTEVLKQRGTPEGGGTPYPLHPLHSMLAHSVFTSSMVAIDYLLDHSRAFPIGEADWPSPFSFWVERPEEEEPPADQDKAEGEGEEITVAQQNKEAEQVAATEQTKETVQKVNRIQPSVLEFNFDDLIWTLRFHTGTKVEHWRFHDSAGLHVYRKLLSQPNVRLRADTLEDERLDPLPEDLLKELDKLGEGNRMRVHDPKWSEPKTDQQTIDEMDEQIAEYEKELAIPIHPERRLELETVLKFLREERKGLIGRGCARQKSRPEDDTKPDVTKIRKTPRKDRSPYEKDLNKVGGQLIRAQQKIGRHMPEFEKYLRKKVRQLFGYFVYLP
jgi:hypothetical protein